MPLEAPLILPLPLPLAAGSGSHEGHMLVDVGSRKARCGWRKEKLGVRGIEREGGRNPRICIHWE